MTGAAKDVSIGGKEVTLMTATIGGSVFDESCYGYGDVVVKVRGGREEIIATAFSLLP